MWYPATIKVAGSEPVTPEQAKAQLHIAADDTSQDAAINLAIKGARAYVEAYCGIRIATQTVTAKCDCLADFCRVATAPVQSVNSIIYSAPDGTEQTLPETVFELRNEGLAPSIVLKPGQVWPAIQPGTRIAVEMVAGYDPAPDDLVSAILLRISSVYALSREDLFKRSETVEGVGETVWSGGTDVTAVMDRTVASLLENYRNWAMS